MSPTITYNFCTLGAYQILLNAWDCKPKTKPELDSEAESKLVLKRRRQSRHDRRPLSTCSSICDSRPLPEKISRLQL